MIFWWYFFDFSPTFPFYSSAPAGSPLFCPSALRYPQSTPSTLLRKNNPTVDFVSPCLQLQVWSSTEECADDAGSQSNLLCRWTQNTNAHSNAYFKTPKFKAPNANAKISLTVFPKGSLGEGVKKIIFGFFGGLFLLIFEDKTLHRFILAMGHSFMAPFHFSFHFGNVRQEVITHSLTEHHPVTPPYPIPIPCPDHTNTYPTPPSIHTTLHSPRCMVWFWIPWGWH